MSDPQLLQVPKQQDKALIKCFRELMEKYDDSSCSFQVIGYPNVGNVNLLEPNEVISLLEKNNTTLIDQATVSIRGFSIQFHRGGLLYYRNQHRQRSQFFDEFAFPTNTNTTLDTSERLDIAAHISKKLLAIHPARTASKNNAEQQQLEAIHTATLERLESLNEELIQGTNIYRAKLDEQHDQKIKSLEEKYSEKENSLEEGILEKSHKLEEEKGKLEEKRKELDDRNNTHARREIRKDILKEIKDRQTKFSLTDGTNELRKPIFWGMIGLIAVFLSLAVFSAFEFYKVIQDDDFSKIIISGIKQLAYSAGTIGSIIFLIRWQNRWFEQHSMTEFKLKQFELDMERASWLVETSLEWKDAKGTQIPPELMSSLSNNLFAENENKVAKLEHPADQLASALLGSASSVKLKSGDSSIEIDPKKLQKSKSESST